MELLRASVNKKLRIVALVLLFILLSIFLLRYFSYFEPVASYCIRNPFNKNALLPSDLECSIPSSVVFESEEDTSDLSDNTTSETIVDNNIYDESDDSPTSLIVSGPVDPVEYLTDEQLKPIGGFIEFREALASGEDASDSWDWSSDFAYAKVENIRPDSKEIYLTFIFPTEETFLEEAGKKISKVECADYSTAIASRFNLTIDKVGVNLYNNVIVEKDKLFFKCLDERCSSIGGECIIVRDSFAN